MRLERELGNGKTSEKQASEGNEREVYAPCGTMSNLLLVRGGTLRERERFPGALANA